MLDNNKYILLSENYLNKTINFAIDCFMKKEHITKVFNMSYDDLYPLTSWLCNVSMQQKLGYIAYDREEHEVVGFFLAKSSSTEFTTQLNEKMKVIEQISTELMDKAMQFPFAQEEFCHLLFIGFISDSNSSRKKKQFNFASFIKFVINSLSEKKQFKYVYMECTNTRSQKVAKFYGCKLLNKLTYEEISEDYKINNTDLQEVACISFLKEL